MSDEQRRKRARKRTADDGAEETRERRGQQPPPMRIREGAYRRVAEIATADELAIPDALHAVLDLGLEARRVGWSPDADTRPAREALGLATLALASASDERARAVATILRDGAGHMPLPEGATLSSPSGLTPDRREAWSAVAEAIRIDSVGIVGNWDDAAVWRPGRSGEWESVLATLLVERAWDEIERTARRFELEGLRS